MSCSVFCVLNVQKLLKRCNVLLEVIKLIPTDQLMLSLICHFIWNIRNERKNNLFHPEGHKCPMKFLLNR